MSLYLFIVFISFIINALLIIPFINFLYHSKIQRSAQKTKDAFDKPTPIFDKYNISKEGTPVGGGLLIILTTIIIFFIFILSFLIFKKKIVLNYPSLFSEIKIILFTFISFGLLGIYDDLNKIFFGKAITLLVFV